MPIPKNEYAAHYYVELDLMRYIETTQSKEFAQWLRANFEPVDPVFRLAEKGSVILMNGGGFDGPEWSVRVSLANLKMASYEKIGIWLREVMEDYLAEFEASGGNKPRAKASPKLANGKKSTAAPGKKAATKARAAAK